MENQHRKPTCFAVVRRPGAPRRVLGELPVTEVAEIPLSLVEVVPTPQQNGDSYYESSEDENDNDYVPPSSEEDSTDEDDGFVEEISESEGDDNADESGGVTDREEEEGEPDRNDSSEATPDGVGGGVGNPQVDVDEGGSDGDDEGGEQRETRGASRKRGREHEEGDEMGCKRRRGG